MSLRGSWCPPRSSPQSVSATELAHDPVSTTPSHLYPDAAEALQPASGSDDARSRSARSQQSSRPSPNSSQTSFSTPPRTKTPLYNEERLPELLRLAKEMMDRLERARWRAVDIAMAKIGGKRICPSVHSHAHPETPRSPLAIEEEWPPKAMSGTEWSLFGRGTCQGGYGREGLE